jgi:HK97 family phage portal protein
MGLLTRVIDAVRPRVTKDVALTPTSPQLVKIFGWSSEGDETLDSPYSQLPIIYAAIRAPAKVLSQTDLKVMRGDREMEKGDPIYSLFKQPNKTQSPFEFKEALGTNLQVAGNAFIVLGEDLVRGIPVEMNALPASYFKPKFAGENEFVGWVMKRGKREVFLPPERVVHISTYNMTDELMGMAPLDVLKMTYKSLWDALLYNKKFFENDGTPPIIYKSANVLPQQYRDSFKKEIIERRRGVKHAHEAQLVEAMDVTTLGFTQKDIQFLELIKQAEGDVLMVFGVTKTQVSKYEDVNYATALSQDKVFISNTCIPMMRQIESEINSQWLNKIGYSVQFDERSNEAMTYLAADEATKVVNLTNAGIVTINEAREMVGLDPVPWGDDEPKPPPAPAFPVAPVPPAPPEPPAPKKPAVEPAPEDEEDVKKKAVEKALFDEVIGKARRTNTWHALNNVVKPIEKRCAAAVKRYFFDAELKARSQVGKALTKAADLDLDALFSDPKLYAILRQYLGQSIVAGADTMGATVNIDDPGIKQFLANRVQFMKGINDNARAGLQEKLDKLLQESMDNSWTEQQRTDAIKEMLSESFSSLKSHARSIARTEVHGAFSEGRWEVCKEIEPSVIEWVSSRDMMVRDTHAELDGQRVKFQSAFSNGCRYPLDPNGSAGEVINCRCTFQTHF